MNSTVGYASAQNNQLSQANAPQVVYGVQSAMKRLHESATTIRAAASKLRGTIGISAPPQDNNKVSSEGSLASYIDEATRMLDAAMEDLEATAQHLGS